MKRTSYAKQAVLVVAAALAFATGCSVNQKATDACKSSPTMEDCQECCKKNGASGHSAKYIGDTKECKCLGG
ncbi:MAG: hypothetical protein JRI23_09650 [Deltaproteobacteria bacterium]|jgi:hypothetical protein|nr:hypothetical protein [Deltaproteobacteria bacterium]MBW2531919.1 hypothetical protein [Deltaproteobacteria bacterium]